MHLVKSVKTTLEWELRLHLGHGVVDGDAGAFVQDLDAEDLHGGSSSVFVRSGQGDVEGQDLIGVPGLGFDLHAADGRHRHASLRIDRRAGGSAVATNQRRLEDRVLGHVGVKVGLELGANVVDVGDELAAEFVDQGKQAVAIEVDPDEGAGDAALVAEDAAGEAAEDKNRRVCGSARFGSMSCFV